MKCIEYPLKVVPQLISRLDSEKNVIQLIKKVLIDLSKAHPQVFFLFHLIIN